MLIYAILYHLALRTQPLTQTHTHTHARTHTHTHTHTHTFKHRRHTSPFPVKMAQEFEQSDSPLPHGAASGAIVCFSHTWHADEISQS